MTKKFLYIDESKNIEKGILELTVCVSRHNLGYCNRYMSDLKEGYNVITELHGYRRKTSRIFWDTMSREGVWKKDFIFEKVYHFKFIGFRECGDIWMEIYRHIIDIIDDIRLIYADKITLSSNDMKLLKYEIQIRGISIEFLSSTTHESIQMVDLICGYIRDESYPQRIENSLEVQYNRVDLKA